MTSRFKQTIASFLSRKERVYTYTDQNPKYARYDIGDWTYGEPEVLSWDKSTCLTIGKFCSIAPKVVIALGGEHRTDWITTFPFSVLLEKGQTYHGHPKSKGNVVIENDVWVGYGALILSGITIANGAVVGARSVVTKDIGPYAIVAGNPARQVGVRFSDETVRSLQSIAWWQWPLPKIVESLPFLLSDDVQSFVLKHG